MATLKVGEWPLGCIEQTHSLPEPQRLKLEAELLERLKAKAPAGTFLVVVRVQAEYLVAVKLEDAARGLGGDWTIAYHMEVPVERKDVTLEAKKIAVIKVEVPPAEGGK